MSTTEQNQATNDEAELRDLIARWSKAVCDRNMAGISAGHDPGILMFDVPPPLPTRGLEAWMETWKTFFAWSTKPVAFDLRDVEVTAGPEVSFATALGRCSGTERNDTQGIDKTIEVEFRLTMGFRKHAGRWRIVHEHHSVPATD